MIDNDSLTFEGEMVSGPSTADLIIRDDEDVLVTAVRRKDAESVWTIRGYTVYGDGIEFGGLNVSRANLAAIIVEQFDGGDLQMRSRYSTMRPVGDGLPVVVAVDGKPAIAAWIFVDETERGEIADLMDVSRDTVTEYLSRFRRRGDGIPDGLELPAIDEAVREIPDEFMHPADRNRLVADGGIEQSDRYRFGWRFDEDSEMVWNPLDRGTGPIIQHRKGEIEDRYIGRAKRKRGEGRGLLWGRLGPVEIDGIEIRQNTKLWHDDREVWLRAVEIDVSDDPEPIILFKIDGSWPNKYVEYYGSDLEELRDAGIIESQKEVNDQAEAMLEELREAKS